MSDYVQRGDATTTGQTAEQWSYGNWSITQPIEGLRTSIDALAAIYRGSGIAYTITPLEGPSARLDVQYQGAITPTESPITTEYKFTTRGAVVPITEHPQYVANLDILMDIWFIAAGETYVHEGLRCLAAYNAGQDTSDFDSAYITDIQNPGNGLIGYCRMILSGTTSYVRPDPVLAVSKKYQATAVFLPSMAIVGTVYTNAALDTALSLPTAVESAIPSGEWLCEEVDLEYQSDGTKVVTQTFRYAVEWNSDLYTHA